VKRASTVSVIITAVFTVAVLAPVASAKFTTHNSPGLATETDSVSCGDHISGRSGWTSLIPPDQIGTLPPAATSGTALYDVFSFPEGWNFASDEFVWEPPAAPFYKDGDAIAPRVLTFFTDSPRRVLATPELAQDNVSWVYAVVPFDETLDPVAPVGSILGIGPPGPVILNKLTVVDCYTFTGFSAPVDNAPTVNVAKAGSSIPLKFRVTDANGDGVPGLTSPPVVVSSEGGPCGGAVGDEIEQYTGGSGLQDLGNGYYQFNWKTPKSYKGHCRTVMVSLGDGNERHTAEFSFR